MPDSNTPVSSEEGRRFLEELERRQDEVLTQLDELNDRILKVLESFGVRVATQNESPAAG